MQARKAENSTLSMPKFKFTEIWLMSRVPLVSVEVISKISAHGSQVTGNAEQF